MTTNRTGMPKKGRSTNIESANGFQLLFFLFCFVLLTVKLTISLFTVLSFVL